MDNTTKRMVKLTNDRKERDDQIKELNKTIQEKDHLYAALENENGILTDKLAKHDKAQRDGYLAIAKDKDGMIVNIAEVLGYSEYTFVQDIPKVYYHKNYNRFKVLETNNGHITINTQKLKKYKSLGGYKMDALFEILGSYWQGATTLSVGAVAFSIYSIASYFKKGRFIIGLWKKGETHAESIFGKEAVKDFLIEAKNIKIKDLKKEIIKFTEEQLQIKKMLEFIIKTNIANGLYEDTDLEEEANKLV